MAPDIREQIPSGFLLFEIRTVMEQWRETGMEVDG